MQHRFATMLNRNWTGVGGLGTPPRREQKRAVSPGKLEEVCDSQLRHDYKFLARPSFVSIFLSFFHHLSGRHRPAVFSLMTTASIK